MADDLNGSGTGEKNGRRGDRRWLSSGVSDADVSFETIFDVLRNEHRLRVLLVLMQASGSVTTIEEIADHLHEWEEERGSSTPLSKKQIRLDLYHIHVPKLAATDLIDYDGSTGTITYQGSDRLERILSVVNEDSPGP